jgi:CMP/dCMP kinase
MDISNLHIAISGKSGCGNSTVSRVLADRLGVRLINYTFHTMADEQNVSFAEMCEMAESDDRWDIYLDKKQIEMAMEGPCVLGSRLAIWLLEEADLKVFLDASLDVRTKRIQEREGGDLDTVLKQTTERDVRDRARYMRLYQIDNDKFDFADIVIDAGKMTVDEIVDEIIQSIQ